MMSLDQLIFNRTLEMPKLEIPFVGPAYQMQEKQLDAQDCINWYLTMDPSGKHPKALLERPGLSLFAHIVPGSNTIRGSFKLRGKAYIVSDNKCYILYKNASVKELGTLESSFGRVSITANNFQIFITDSENGYVYQFQDNGTRKEGDFFTIENASSTIDDPDFFGTGEDDLSVFGPYTGESTKTYKIVIDTPTGVDTFKWSDDGGLNYNETGVPITGSKQLLNDGIEISFINKTDHTVGDFWTIQVTIDSAFYAPVLATYQDGFGIYVRPNSNRFYISAINDFSQVDALDYASANIYPDNLVASVSIHEELWMIGEQTTQIYYNTGNADFPFSPRTNLIINYGTEAPWSVKTGADNIIFMLSKNNDGDRIIVGIANYTPKTISSEALNQELNTYEIVDDAFAMLIERNGHLFYIITFPSYDRTWVFDASIGEWHEWRSFLENDVPRSFEYRWGMFRGNTHTVFDGKDLIGDSVSGKVFFLDPNSSYDGDEATVKPIKRQRTCQHMQQNLEFQSVNSLQIDVESGTGLTEGQGEDPQLMLQVSRDSGKTYGAEMWRSAGRLGKYANRALWYTLGTNRVFTYRLQKTDPTKMAVLGAVADIEVNQ